MTQEEIVECFEKHDGQFLKFKEVKAPLSSRPDLHAFLTLDRLVPSGSDMVCGAEHDEIFLDVNVEQLKKAGITEETVIDLIRCGVRLDEEGYHLCMFA